jgi:hypothetical protein
MPGQDFYPSPFSLGPPPPPAPPSPPSFATTPATWQDIIRAHAEKAGIDPRLALSVAEIESSFNPDAMNPESGATGLFQLMPATAKRRGVTDFRDPIQNIQAGIGELKDLLGTYNNDVVLSLRRYNGSPRASEALTNDYVQKVLAAVEKRRGDVRYGPLQSKAPPMARDPSTAAPASPFATGPLGQGLQRTLAGQEGGYSLPTLARWAKHNLGFDPQTAEDRPNIGAAIGSTVGGTAGSFLGPWSAAIGSALGSTAGGYFGQMYNERFGPPPAPGDTSTPGERMRREALIQGALDVAPGLVLGPIKGATRAALEEGISAAAKNALAAARQGSTEAFDVALDTLKTAIRTRGASLAEQSAALRTQTIAQKEAARTAAQTSIIDPALAHQATAEQGVIDAREAARRNFRTVARTGRADVRAATKAGEAGVTQARTAGQGSLDVARSAFLTETAARRTGQIPAGQAVLDVVAGEAAPVTLARRRLGARVPEAAATGPMINLRPQKAEANRVLKEALGPVETFPNAPPPQTTHLADPRLRGPQSQVLEGPPVHTPPRVPFHTGEMAAEDPQIAAFLRGVEGNRYDELLKDPVMVTVAKIVNAPDDVPMATLHQWYSDLASAKSGLFDPGMKSKVEGLQKHLIGELRGALASAKHKPYEKAAAEYRAMMQLFERGNLDEIQQAAIKGPEKIVQMIDPDSPTQVAEFMRILREVPAQAKKSGSKTSGRRAWCSRPGSPTTCSTAASTVSPTASRSSMPSPSSSRRSSVTPSIRTSSPTPEPWRRPGRTTSRASPLRRPPPRPPARPVSRRRRSAPARRGSTPRTLARPRSKPLGARSRRSRPPSRPHGRRRRPRSKASSDRTAPCTLTKHGACARRASLASRSCRTSAPRSARTRRPRPRRSPSRTARSRRRTCIARRAVSTPPCAGCSRHSSGCTRSGPPARRWSSLRRALRTRPRRTS